MGSTSHLAADLHHRRMQAVEQLRSLVTAASTRQNGVFSGEQERQYTALNADIDILGNRIDELISLEKRNHELDTQREKFARILHSDDFDRGPKRSIVLDALRGEGPKVFSADFRHLSHKVEPDGRLTIESWDLSKASNAAGAFTVPADFLEELFRHLVENSGIRAAGARQLTTDDGRSMPIPKTLTHGGAAAVAENNPIAESDPTFGQAVLTAWKFGQLIQVSNELAVDTGVDLDGYLADSAGSNLGLASGAEYILGDGTTEPDGVAVSPSVGVTGAAGTGLTVKGDDLIDLYHSIVSGYRNVSSWLMRDVTLAFIRKIKTGVASSVEYLWQPGLAAGAPDTILGRPIFTDPAMPAMAINAYSILFGDFARHYVIRDVVGVRFEVSQDYAFNTDQITFRALLRTDGKRVDLTAVKAYRNGAS